MATFAIRPARLADRDALGAMRAALWPESSPEEQNREVDALLGGEATAGILPVATFVSSAGDGSLNGFIEVGLRSHADGCDPARPVGFIEGWFVQQDARKQGVGAALMRAAEDWARSRGCREMASDTWIDHDLSQRAHLALGFEIVDRCVHFRKPL
jgi:aminoglycoside 6'-N-acetyltransferase I